MTPKWTSVYPEPDWRKTNPEIAAEIGITPSWACNLRRKFAPDTVHRRRAVKNQNIDWSRKTADIAREIGCGPSYISHVRGLQAPHTLGQHWGAHRIKVDWEGLEMDMWLLSDAEIGRRVGVSRERVGQKRAELFGRGIGGRKR